MQIRAGHSSIKVTLDVCGHLFPGDDEAVAEALDEGRRAALEGFQHPVGMKIRNGKVTGLKSDADLHKRRGSSVGRARD